MTLRLKIAMLQTFAVLALAAYLLSNPTLAHASDGSCGQQYQECENACELYPNSGCMCYAHYEDCVNGGYQATCQNQCAKQYNWAIGYGQDPDESENDYEQCVNLCTSP